MNALIQYLRDVRNELTHISWPSNAQATGFTVLVVIIVVVVALFLGAADYLFTEGIAFIINTL